MTKLRRDTAARKYNDLQVEAALQLSIYSDATSMNGLADQEDLRFRFHVLTKTKSPELHRCWTTHAPAAANGRLFRLVDRGAPRDRGQGLPPEPGLGVQGLPVLQPVLGVGIAGGEAQRREDVPARFKVYRSADNGLRV